MKVMSDGYQRLAKDVINLAIQDLDANYRYSRSETEKLTRCIDSWLFFYNGLYKTYIDLTDYHEERLLEIAIQTALKAVKKGVPIKMIEIALLQDTLQDLKTRL